MSEKVALVTGGGTGVGKAAALALLTMVSGFFWWGGAPSR